MPLSNKRLPLELKFLINAQGIYWNKYGKLTTEIQSTESSSTVASYSYLAPVGLQRT